MVGLPDLAGGGTSSLAGDVSGDGSVVVGYGSSANGQEAFRWTAAGGIVGLGDLPGGSTNSNAYSISGDGSVVVGLGTTADGNRAFIWDGASGMRNLQTVLANDYGQDLTGWTLTEARSISADGKTITGWGYHNGNIEGWVATIPEPSSLALLGAGLLALPRLRRWRRR